MLGVTMYTTIETLYKRGLNKSEISRATKHDWKTVDKVIKAIQKGKYIEKKSHPNQLDNYKDKILEYLDSGLSGVRVHEKLQTLGCYLSYSSVRNYIKNLKQKENICIRFHTEPGEEAQVDFGYVGRLPDETGKIRKAWIFNMRLSYSRMDFYKVVFDQTVETFIKCHMDAFKYFEGIPHVVRIDNLKAAILEANFYQPIYQSLYKQYADYHNFQIIPCRVRKPQEKGKVEAGIKYIKNNFFAGRQFINNKELQKQLLDWLNNKCNARIHGTTRKIPNELFQEKERSLLLALPSIPFKQIQVSTRKVQRDCHIYVDYNYYSIPYQYTGKIIDIENDNSLIKCFYEGEQIAVHAVLTNRGNFSTNESHYPAYKLPFSDFSKQRIQDKMKNIGNYADDLFDILLKKQPNHWHRTANGILSLQKCFDNTVINLACNRAIHYGAIQYRQIKAICESGSYNLPIIRQEIA